MIVYRPSRGNNTVALTYEGGYAGQSIGREIIIKDKYGPTDYFSWVYSDLSSDDNWFFKPITNVDFNVGTTYYRSLYIGPSERENLQEFIGTISSSVVSCQSSGTSGMPSSGAPTSGTSGTSGTSDITLGLFLEGIFTTNNSKNTIVLDNEYDTTKKLQNAMFNQSLVINTTLSIGQWAKIWIKINIPKLNYIPPYDCYTVNIGGLSIKLNYELARLSLSNVFHGKLNGNTVVSELIPEFGDIDKIHKIINDDTKSNIFYNDSDNKLFNLIVQRKDNINDNKYCIVDLSNISGPVDTIPNTKDIKADESIFTCITGSNFNKKYIIDIFKTNIQTKNYYYVFYNELKMVDDSETISTISGDIQRYYATYNLNRYYWQTGVMFVDLTHFSDDIFADIKSGIENSLSATNWTAETNIIKKDVFTTSISLQDDLFTLVGYDVENTYESSLSGDFRFVSSNKNFQTNINLLWEKDIIKKDIQIQSIKTPNVISLTTIDEKSNSVNKLIFDNISSLNMDDLKHEKSVFNLFNTSGQLIKYCDVGSPHGYKLKHFNDCSMWIDIDDNSLNEWVASFSFRLPCISIPVSSANIISHDETFVSHNTILYKTDYSNSSLISEPLFILPPSLSGNLNIFNINVLSSNISPVKFNYSDNKITVISMDASGNSLSHDISGFRIKLNQENTITVRTIKKQITDICGILSSMFCEIYLNGDLIWGGKSYIKGTLDPLTITYNPSKQFSGSISFVELKSYIDDIDVYAKCFYNIQSNISWSNCVNNTVNTIIDKNLQKYKHKSVIRINQLPNINSNILYPIILKGHGYLVDNFNIYNERALRSVDLQTQKNKVFDFNKINLNKIDIAVTWVGSSIILDSMVSDYDILNDTLTVWVNLPYYNGNELVIYYNTQDIDDTTKTSNNNPFKINYSTWIMDKFIKTFNNRFTNQKIFNSGENILYLKNNDTNYIVQIDNLFMTGIKNVYKSNKFDISIKDDQMDREQFKSISDFINTYIKTFKPDIMTLNKVVSKYDYITETENYTPKG